MLVGQALATGELLAPEDGAANWTTPADLAPAAAVVLSRDGEFDGRTPPPAASQSIALEELAAVASEVHGRQITRVTVSEADYRDALIGRGMLLLLHRGARSGAEWAHPLRYLPAGDRYVIFGLNGGATTPPAWFHNLAVHPDASIEVGDNTVAVTAVELTGPERDRAWREQFHRSPQCGEAAKHARRIIPVIHLRQLPDHRWFSAPSISG